MRFFSQFHMLSERRQSGAAHCHSGQVGMHLAGSESLSIKASMAIKDLHVNITVRALWRASSGPARLARPWHKGAACLGARALGLAAIEPTRRPIEARVARAAAVARLPQIEAPARRLGLRKQADLSIAAATMQCHPAETAGISHYSVQHITCD